MCSVEGDRLYPLFAHQAVHRLGKKQIADEGNGEKGLHSASKERGARHNAHRDRRRRSPDPIHDAAAAMQCRAPPP